jgi:ABC-type polysaccharide/polyol phosphate transport system ATPase subunit
MAAETSQPSRPAVVVDGLSKTFAVPREHVMTIKERALHPLKRVRHDTFEALNDVSFAVEQGEFFGIVGRNGSGKSTLLKCLAGIYKADAGEMYVDGRMSTFIELGVGFNPDLAARDNVIMNAIMLGLTPKEARSLVDPVIEFAELEEFVELKLKNYSSGMHVRLAFSVMLQAQSDIMLIDEVLAVGDASFQQKCYDEFNRMRDEGRTILFVTHDMGSVTRFCHRALLLERGRIVTIGEPAEVASEYLELNFGRETGETTTKGDVDERPGDRSARIVEAWVEDDSGERVLTCMQGRIYAFKATVEFLEEVDDPAFTWIFYRADHLEMMVATTAWRTERSGHFAKGQTVVVTVSFENVFGPGRYHPSVIVAHRGRGDDVIDRWDQIFSFMVAGPHASGGAIDVAHEIDIDRAVTPPPSTSSLQRAS